MAFMIVQVTSNLKTGGNFIYDFFPYDCSINFQFSYKISNFNLLNINLKGLETGNSCKTENYFLGSPFPLQKMEIRKAS